MLGARFCPRLTLACRLLVSTECVPTWPLFLGGLGARVRYFWVRSKRGKYSAHLLPRVKFTSWTGRLEAAYLRSGAERGGGGQPGLREEGGAPRRCTGHWERREEGMRGGNEEQQRRQDAQRAHRRHRESGADLRSKKPRLTNGNWFALLISDQNWLYQHQSQFYMKFLMKVVVIGAFR